MHISLGYVLLTKHTLLAALVAVSSHLSPTALIFLEAGGTIAAIAQLLHQVPLFLEAARCTAARFMSCHKKHPLSSGGFKTDLEQPQFIGSLLLIERLTRRIQKSIGLTIG